MGVFKCPHCGSKRTSILHERPVLGRMEYMCKCYDCGRGFMKKR